MSRISLNLPDCWAGLRPPEVDLVNLPCLGVDDIAASEVKSGGRTLVVTPYFPPGSPGTGRICSGQYGQWQVLTGLGGQIHRGLFVGDKFTKEDSAVDPPGVSSEVDKTDCVRPGDRCLAIRDRGRWYVIRMGGAGEATSAGMIVGLVLGGNALPSTLDSTPRTLQDPVLRPTFPSPDDTTDEYGYLPTDYPSRRPFAFTLPDGVGAPIINDWRKYDIPDDYEFGGTLPRCPDGICYVRVERPYTLDTASWDGSSVSAPPRPSAGAQDPVKAVFDGGVVVVWYRHEANFGLTGGATWILSPTFSLPAATPAALNSVYQVTAGGTPIDLGGGWIVGVGALAYDTNGSTTLTLYKFLSPAVFAPLSPSEIEGLPDIRISVPPGVLQSSLDSTTQSTAASLNVGLGKDKSSVVICLNDSARQGFRAGDLVYVEKAALALSDRYGIVNPGGNQSRTVYRILGGISGVRSNITSY